MSFDELLPYLWALIIGVNLLLYIVLDGFDLGVGMLFQSARSESERRTMLRAIGPVWDGNETWLVASGTALFAAFPVVYSILLPALYLPVIFMLIALVFRGVAIEFRNQSTHMRAFWDSGFFIGSLVAAFCQGAIIATLMQGIPLQDNQFHGNAMFWLTPFSVTAGVGLIVGYLLLGSTWLVLKTGGDLQQRAFRIAAYSVLASGGFLLLLFVYTLATNHPAYRVWEQRPLCLLIPAAGLIAGSICYRSLQRRREMLPFVMATAIITCGLFILLATIWPYIVPYSLTIPEAAASPASLRFLFYGVALVVMPVMLVFTALIYWSFRGKVPLDDQP